MSEDPGNDGPRLSIVRSELLMAEELKRVQAEAPPAEERQAEEPSGTYGRAPRRRIPYRDDELPQGCPITPLGRTGGTCWFLDASNQIRGLEDSSIGHKTIMGLYGAKTDLLWRFYPRFNKDAEQTGWRPEFAQEDLMRAAAVAGIWQPLDVVRGAGAWRDDEGRLVLHMGDAVMVAGELKPPGMIDGYVYPALPRQPRPHQDAQRDGPDGPAEEVLSMLRTWSWKRPDLDPRLLLGGIAASMLGGALHWRPMIWLTGDRGTGKSTLQLLLEYLYGTGGMVKSGDATAAGIWQRIGQNSIPIALDELEPSANSDQVQKVIKLARLAASGDVVLRGGADHQGSEFKARSCFLFSSILVPPLLGQDRSRMAILDLLPLKGSPPPQLVPRHWRDLGTRLRRRLLDRWPAMHEVLEAWRMGLAARGFDARGCDQFGTLLACADLLLHDDPPTSDDLNQWCDLLATPHGEGSEDDARDHERCLDWLLTSPLPAFRGGTQRTVGSWIGVAAGEVEGTDMADRNEAQRVLSEFGLRVVDQDREKWLAVANSHRGVGAIYADTQWKAEPGTPGVWMQSLRRIEGARAHGELKFAGVGGRCTLIPIRAVFGQAAQATAS